MSYGLGIDLGTTFTAAATNRGGRVEMVTLGDRAAAIPSVILVRENGGVLVGDAADRRAASEPERIAREVKRRLGDPTPLILGGSPHSVQSILSQQLRWVVDAAAEREGGRPERLVLTHPANWGPYKREQFASVPQLAGVGRVTTVTEPEAAAVHYAANERVEQGSLVAVYDLGGGTFDATVLRKSPRGFEILGTPEGIEGLGGIDFDEAVYAHVDRSLDHRLAEVDLDDDAAAAALVRLRRECVLAKEALSSDTETTIPVLVPGLPSEVRLTRAEMEEMIRPSIDATVAALRRALASARVAPGDLSTVLLVGGSSRIPLVSQMLSEELGRPTAVDTHPKHAVALGAAGLLDANRAATRTPPQGMTPPGGFAPGMPPQTPANGTPRPQSQSQPQPQPPSGPQSRPFRAPVPTPPELATTTMRQQQGTPTNGTPTNGTPRPSFGAGDAPPSLSGRGSSTSSTSSGSSSGSSSGRGDGPRSRRRTVPFVLAGAVLLLGAVVGGVVAFGSPAPTGGATLPPAQVAPAGVATPSSAPPAVSDGGGSGGGQPVSGGSGGSSGSGGGGSSSGGGWGGGGSGNRSSTSSTTTTTTTTTSKGTSSDPSKTEKSSGKSGGDSDSGGFPFSG